MKNEAGNLFKKVKNERQKEYLESLGYKEVKEASIKNPELKTPEKKAEPKKAAAKKAAAKKGDKSKDVKLD